MRRKVGILAFLVHLGAATTNAEPVVFTNEASFLAELATLSGTVIHESFEDDVAWESSRNSIASPGSTPYVTSQRLLWTSNYSQNNIATGTVGGSAPDSDAIAVASRAEN